MSARSFMILLVVGILRTGLSSEAGTDVFAPQARNVDQYASIWTRAPFIQESPPPPPPPSISFTARYRLTGISSIDATAVVFLVDTAIGDPVRNRFTLSQSRGDAARGLELVSVKLDRDPRNSRARLRLGAEEAEIPIDTSTVPQSAPQLPGGINQ